MSNQDEKSIDDQKEDAKERILYAAVEMMLDPSFSTLNTNDLAKKASVSKGLVFHHFKSKDKLIIAALREIINKLFESDINPEEMELELPPDVILREFTKRNLEFIIYYPNLTALLLQIVTDMKDKSHLQELEEFFLEFFEETIDRLNPMFLPLGWEESEVLEVAKLYIGILDGLGLQQDIKRNLIHHAEADHHRDEIQKLGVSDIEKMTDIIVALFDKRRHNDK